jgi:spore coat protein U-like protein
MNRTLKTAIALAVFAMSAGSAVAASNPATTTFQVKLTVLKACTVTATDLNFGSQDANAAAFNEATAGTVTVTCSKTTPYKVGLAPLAANGGTANGTGNMVSTTAPATNLDKVAYTLYSDAARTSPWGNTVGTNTVNGTGTGAAAAALQVYGKVASANVTPDSYADTVTVNVTY